MNLDVDDMHNNIMAEAGSEKAFNTVTHRVESLHLESKVADSSHADHAEDEIVTWLQYPLEDTLERVYCSELFGQLSSTLGKAEPASDDMVPTGKGDCGNCGSSTRSENAEDALALGAGRASGFVAQAGAEAFSKVKTAMQQPPCPQSSSSPGNGSSYPISHSPSQTSHEKCEPSALSATMLPPRFANISLLANNSPVHGALHNSSTNGVRSSASPSTNTISPKQDKGKIKFSGSTAAGSTLCEPSYLIKSNVSKKGSDALTQMSYTRGSSYSHIKEDHMKRISNHFTSGSHGELLCTAQDNAGTSARLASPIKERGRQEKNVDACVVVPDVVMPSCSGGSQTSAEMSVKETSSMGKEKVEDYDCQSEDAEGDFTEISQPRKHLSKRSRVAESHNLSEKRRRNRINQKLKALQELIPNSSKTDKASILDEAIEYLKTLQLQLQMMSTRTGMSMSPMIIPAGMQHMQMAHMSPVHPIGLGLPMVHTGMSMGVGMGSMDFSHGISGRPFQALPTTSPHFNMTYSAPTAVASQNCNQACTNMEVPSSDFWALQQASAQPYQHVCGEPHTVSCVDLHQQGEQFSTPRISKEK